MLFTITADQDRAVKEAIKAIKKEEWQPYEKDREIAETVHTMNDTKEAFRFIVRRWPKLQGDFLTLSPILISCQRHQSGRTSQRGSLSPQPAVGEVENFIKELKGGFGMNWIPCGETHANAVFFRIGE